jgi:hypothetical protein
VRAAKTKLEEQKAETVVKLQEVKKKRGNTCTNRAQVLMRTEGSLVFWSSNNFFT